MILLWADHAWNDYLYWQQADKKILNVNPLKVVETQSH